eukprot:CAMPEP_0119117874 /NCGR_PEP_ID=MMETSP1180-20130426/53084_1 /TAXON_ID=3052 ORGANISM="Chlamydomonas cf sp, Strain CCMP681" /NCGR_SAMPLE_ID=MMETSP1180 /ASSEMBLY_ACC=CAM_ASM_000741 /LENGTH=109 /DNA_ID=CAMNT_0007107185 /DNA_START=60 /DNA_END=389 /DNA_ORIENTATION=+
MSRIRCTRPNDSKATLVWKQCQQTAYLSTNKYTIGVIERPPSHSKPHSTGEHRNFSSNACAFKATGGSLHFEKSVTEVAGYISAVVLLSSALTTNKLSISSTACHMYGT